MNTDAVESLPTLIAGNNHLDSSFQAIMEALPVAVYMTDARGRLTYFNSAAVKLSGRTPQLGTDEWCVTWKIFLPDGTPLPHDQCPMALALKTGEVLEGMECIAERPDGTRFWFTPCPAVLRDGEGRIIAGINVLLDITERKKKEVEAKRTERAALLLSAIVDSSDDAIISKDLNGVVTSWNKSAERLFGYRAEEAIGRTIASLIIPADRQEEEPDILARLRRGERIDHFETIRQRKDGSLLDISLTISPVKDSKGNIIGASKIARDITEANRVRAALMESEARFRQLADAMPQMVWTAGPDGQLDYCNQRWYEFTRLGLVDWRDSRWEKILHPEDLQRTRETWRAAIESGGAFNVEYRLWDRHENRWRWFIARAVPVRDAQGRITKWFGTSTDIDEQKRVQEDLERANEDLEQFAFSASHDLQEPLRGIKIYSDLLARRYESKLDGDALKFMTYLRKSATRMETLVRDLLTYTQSTRFDTPEEITNANVALKAALDNLSSVVVESGAQITAAELPAVCLHAMHLQQLFQNLIGNALKYRSQDRPPVIRVAAEPQEGHWVFSVTDNGIGIDPKYKELIFGLFKRLHTSDEYSGTGIGLAICHRIVDQYHGRIWVESEPGKGSTFRFALPR